ncbi:hypothetical protein C3R74_10030 [Acidithiobacillus ferridurans]|uniref:hypothetical protein n=1 Tax=Acidithiobacillus ferridurans TaxID=1232575 RepID=UPI000DE5073F|nr:hypothetical protein [Acidithiobacillus ferridurans]RBL99894.1 hypothetical protein C3R74_10030 [Acidithiobacillus ferridurans]
MSPDRKAGNDRHTPEAAPEDLAIALLRMLCTEGPVSVARACKSLGLPRSQMERLLLLLGNSEQWGGLYVRPEEQRGRTVITLTSEGRTLCAQMQAATE